MARPWVDQAKGCHREDLHNKALPCKTDDHPRTKRLMEGHPKVLPNNNKDNKDLQSLRGQQNRDKALLTGKHSNVFWDL